MIFDRMQDRENSPSGESQLKLPETGSTFKLWFGADSVERLAKPGQTIKEEFRSQSEALGFDFDRRLSFRDNEGNIFTGEEAPAAGREYIAAITHDSKGQ